MFSSTCPRCTAKCTGGRHSTDDSLSMLAYACGTMVWSDGAVLDGRGCLINQVADLKAKLAEAARLAQDSAREAMELICDDAAQGKEASHDDA